MQHLRGTPYWPELEGAILFLETSEEEPTPERVDGILMDYVNMGADGSRSSRLRCGRCAGSRSA